MTFVYEELGLQVVMLHPKPDFDDELLSEYADQFEELLEAAAMGYPI